MRQHAIEMNWRSKPIRQPKMLKGHDDHVITCLQFCGNRIVSGSDDNTLKVWSATTGKVCVIFAKAFPSLCKCCCFSAYARWLGTLAEFGHHRCQVVQS